MREAPGAEEDLARRNCHSRHSRRADDGNRPERGHDQDRGLAFAVGNDGDQRNDAEGHYPDDGRRPEQKGRFARQESRSGRRRSGSNWPLFAEKARDLLSKEKVAAVFGCWTSVSRKSVLPVFEELNGLLYYPVQ